MTWIVRCRKGFTYCCHLDGDVWGPKQGDAMRFRTKASAMHAARLATQKGPPDDPARVVRLHSKVERLRNRLAERDLYLTTLRSLLSNIKAHQDRACPGLVPADCLDAIYESARIASAVLPSSEEKT